MWHVWGTGEVQTAFWWGSRLLGRPRRLWEDNTKVYVKEEE